VVDCSQPNRIAVDDRARPSVGSNNRTTSLQAAVAMAVFVVVLGGFASPSRAQGNPASQQQDAKLYLAWSEACNRVMAGDPWGEIVADVEGALRDAPDASFGNDVAGYLESLRMAAAQSSSLPDGGTDASPADLVALLMKSQLLNPQFRDSALLLRPLHADMRPDRTREVHWVDLGEQPEHRMTDPAIRIFKRGRAMIPALLDTLDDMTATRSGFMGMSSRQPAVVCRRADFAMALLEAITKCQFLNNGRNEWFSLMDPSARSAAEELARSWWAATKDMPDYEARAWLLKRIAFEQARPMIDVFLIEGKRKRAIEYLRDYLVDASGKMRVSVAAWLGKMGDRSALDMIVAKAGRNAQLTRDEIDVLVRYGQRREYLLMHRLVVADKTLNSKTRNNESRAILAAMRDSQNRLAIPVLAEGLYVEDPLRDRMVQQRRSPHGESRSDLAAEYIQRLTQRDFRYDPKASAPSRSKAIERIRAWWEKEGRGLYGFQSDRARQAGGIR